MYFRFVWFLMFCWLVHYWRKQHHDNIKYHDIYSWNCCYWSPSSKWNLCYQLLITDNNYLEGKKLLQSGEAFLEYGSVVLGREKTLFNVKQPLKYTELAKFKAIIKNQSKIYMIDVFVLNIIGLIKFIIIIIIIIITGIIIIILHVLICMRLIKINMAQFLAFRSRQLIMLLHFSILFTSKGVKVQKSLLSK